MPSARLEAFSDGVIAVIVTIMVLELHVPAQSGWAGFLPVLPHIAIYILSFLMVGVYWVNHHELLGRAERINYSALWANLFFLLGLSFIPYATAYAAAKHFDRFSTLFYNVTMMLAGALFFGLRHTVMRLQHLRGELNHGDKVEARKHLLSLAVYLVALPLAWVSPLASFGLNTLVTLWWIVPELGLRRPFAAETHGS